MHMEQETSPTHPFLIDVFANFRVRPLNSHGDISVEAKVAEEQTDLKDKSTCTVTRLSLGFPFNGRCPFHLCDKWDEDVNARGCQELWFPH